MWSTKEYNTLFELSGGYLCRDHCLLAPSALQEGLHKQAAIPARVQYEHYWATYYEPAPGLLLGCWPC